DECGEVSLHGRPEYTSNGMTKPFMRGGRAAIESTRTYDEIQGDMGREIDAHSDRDENGTDSDWVEVQSPMDEKSD
ncbi:hypothetical protein PENTCL1PPCAC_25746, partial [Pristionchus entomophagus]